MLPVYINMFRSLSMIAAHSEPYYKQTREMYPYLSVAAGVAYITLHSIMFDNTQRQTNQAITSQIQELREEVKVLRRRSPLCSTTPFHTSE